MVKNRLYFLFTFFVIGFSCLSMPTKADMVAPDFHLCTRDGLLMNAVSIGSELLAGIMLNLGANAQVRNSLGIPVLMSAVYNHDVDMVTLLLKNGADKSISDKTGKTALMWAKELQLKNIIPLL